MNVEQLAKMLGQSDDDDERDVSFPMPEAQREELRQIFATYTPPVFYTGQFVRWRHGVGPVNSRGRKHIVFVFWDYLDPDDVQAIDRLVTAAETHRVLPTVDCRIAHLAAGTLVFMPAFSRFLEVACNEELF